LFTRQIAKTNKQINVRQSISFALSNVYLFVCLRYLSCDQCCPCLLTLECLFYILSFALSNVYLFVCLRYLSCEQCLPCLFSVYSTFSLLLCLTFICLFVLVICLVNNVARASLVFILHSLFCFV
jgi:hypothetical protein